jgi:hypothetical protein
VDRPDLYDESHWHTGGTGNYSNYKRTRAAEGDYRVLRYDKAPPEGWWPTGEESRRNRILGFWLLAACLFVVFAIGVVVGLAL